MPTAPTSRGSCQQTTRCIFPISITFVASLRDLPDPCRYDDQRPFPKLMNSFGKIATTGPWHQLTAEAVISDLEVDPRSGLADYQVSFRREQFGANQLTPPSKESFF